MSYPNRESQVKFKYIAQGASLPSSLDQDTIYFDENTQHLIVAGVSIYNPIVYNSDSRTEHKTIILTQQEYDEMKEAEPTQIDENTLYLIYKDNLEIE